jgi:hypothetical protein
VPLRHEAWIVAADGKRLVEPISHQAFDVITEIFDRSLAPFLPLEMPVAVAGPGDAQRRIACVGSFGFDPFRFGALSLFHRLFWPRVDTVGNRPNSVLALARASRVLSSPTSLTWYRIECRLPSARRSAWIMKVFVFLGRQREDADY